MPGRISVYIHAIRELGFLPLCNYAIYQFGLRSGLWRLLTPPGQIEISPIPKIYSPFTLPARADLTRIIGGGSSELIQEADEICSGKVRLFGGPPLVLSFKPTAELHHWTAYERGAMSTGADDIKVIWETGRFEWAYTLARAHVLTSDEKYPLAYWENCEEFLHANPPNMGPQWVSAQEVALRLVAMVFALQVFAPTPATTDERREMTVRAVIAHARRILPTLSYARAQQNNHLLSEALGLFLAGISLPGWKESERWRSTGWRLFNHGLRIQVGTDGTYTQHSANYHRLMLQEALLMNNIAEEASFPPPDISGRLAAATNWLLAMMDPSSGRMPNLGHNDGSYILPLATGGYSDYRPVAQAAARAFRGKPCLPPGPWDELSLWLGLPLDRPSASPAAVTSPAVHRLDSVDSWASLRAARFTRRPGHADQLHVDLWWQGQNIAVDAGTYSYNLPPPWDNALMTTLVHNTVSIDGMDQMQRAGRFLWLKRARARMVIPVSRGSVVAEHDGYRSIGINHRRTLRLTGERIWEVMDEIISTRQQNPPHEVNIQWLLPDYSWEVSGQKLSLASSHGHIILKVMASAGSAASEVTGDVRLISAGKVIYGKDSPCSPVLGWVSPTYLVKLPALSFNVAFTASLPLTIVSRFTLHVEER